MKFIKNYLTSEEISVIVAEMLTKSNAVEREIVKIGIVAQILIDEKDLGEFETCDDIYNKIMEQGIDFNTIFNYNIIDKLVKEELGVDKFIKEFLIGFDEKLTKSLDGLDLNGAIQQLGEIANGKY